MLDYLLSRMVLLTFLFLILGLLLAYQNVLSNFFLTGSAKHIAINLAEKIRTVALNTAVSTETKKVRLPSSIIAGPLRAPYSLRIGCKKEGKKLIVGIGIKGIKGNYIYVHRVDLYLPNKDITLEYYGNDINAGDILLIKKESTTNKVKLYIEECGKSYSCNSPQTTVGGTC